MKTLVTKNKSVNDIRSELAKNPFQKLLVKDGKVIMNSLELIEEGGNSKVKLRDFKNMELEIKCTDGNVFVASYNERFTISEPTKFNKHAFILGIYDDDSVEIQQPKPACNKNSNKIRFDNNPFRFR